MRKMDMPGEYYCAYCNKLCKSINSLRQHEIRCKCNKDRIKGGVEFLNEQVHLGNKDVWNKGLSAKENDSIKKQAETLKKKYDEGEFVNPIKNTHHTEEQKLKQRLSTLKYIEACKGNVRQRYNINACKFINLLNEQYGWNLQHAENGGEISVCGYFLDGYDKDLNIAFEYDEKYHYEDAEHNILREKDIKRQTNIINELHCEFYRYNEDLNLFYKVN